MACRSRRVSDVLRLKYLASFGQQANQTPARRRTSIIQRCERRGEGKGEEKQKEEVQAACEEYEKGRDKKRVEKENKDSVGNRITGYHRREGNRV